MTWRATLIGLMGMGCGAAEPLAPGVRIDEAILGQNTGVALVADGALVTTRLQPVVAGREAQLRVVVVSDASRSVTLRVDIDGTTVDKTADVRAGDTVVRTVIPAELLTAGATASLSLLDPEGRRRPGALEGARMPVDAAAFELGVREMPTLELVLVGMDVGEGGPDLEVGTQVDLSEWITALFPVSDITVSVHPDVLPFEADPSSASGLAPAVEAVVDQRAADDPEPHVVYLGLYPSAGGGVGGGLASDSQLVAGRRSAVAPVSTTAPELAYKVAVHELGHVFGALHAPCDASSADPDYPHDDGRIGVRAWDGIEQTWRGPKTADLMGYCADFWMSPYTGGQIAEGMLWDWD